MNDKLPLEPFDVTGLEIAGNNRDLRRDLHIFVEYVRSRPVKRKTRGNELNKSDSKRLAKLMDDSELAQAVQETGGATWIDFVDQMALQSGFVKYDTKGEYRGYSSSEPSFTDNYIEFQEKHYARFLALSPVDQEAELRKILMSIDKNNNCEFFRRSPLGRLDTFNTWGSATGVMPMLNFVAIRQFLLDLLAQCEPGVWYSTKSLVKHLKAHHPFSLIPEKPVIKYPKLYGRPAREEAVARYGNFFEGDHWHKRDPVPDDANDGFERVEGRYIERFLEYIPLVLGYVDIAYREPRTNEDQPSRGQLQAFRVNERFVRAMTGDILPSRITIQPNFEIYIDAAFYPVKAVQQLLPFADVVKSDTVTIMRLERRKVAATLAENDALDVVALLRELADNQLPQNIVIELEEWAGHADVFTLYDGFSLVEGASHVETVQRSTVETISAGMVLVNERDTKALFRQLQRQQHVPLHFRHPDDTFWVLPDGVQTALLTEAEVKVEPEMVDVKMETRITLHFPHSLAFDAVLKGLLDVRCPVDVDTENRTLTLPQKYKKQLNQVIQALQESYIITLEDR